MLENLLDRAVQLLWGRGTIAFTLLCGLYFTVFTHFLPLRKIGLVTQKTLGSLFCKKESKDSVSPFAAVSTALGGTMGVGNIIGVGAALALGGAGSIFWMWVGALLGMMTKYMEVFLAVRWRVRRPGSRSFCGGPMYYCARGIPHPIGKLLAVLFCIFCILSSLSSGSMVQTNAIAQSMQQSFSVSPSLCAVVLVLVCGWVLHGGCDRAVQTCSALVPWMSALYLFGCGIILFHFRQNIPSAFSQILTQAFSSGGIAGAAGSGVGFFTCVRVGISRGIFTHEAGLGSASIAHACSGADSPVEQGFWGIFEVFCDTILVCTITALSILASGVPLGASGAYQAFCSVMGKTGGRLLGISLSLFAFASVISFCLYGQRCVEYLFGDSRHALFLYRCIFLVGCAAGCFARLPVVFVLAGPAECLPAAAESDRSADFVPTGFFCHQRILSERSHPSMFVCSFKPRSLFKKLLCAAAILAAVLLIALTLHPFESPAPVQPAAQHDTCVPNGLAQVRFLQSYGWEVNEQPCEMVQVVIPETFGDVYENYNEIQKQQGFDLSRFRGKQVSRCSYEVLNYPGQKEYIRANLLIYNHEVIGGDICFDLCGERLYARLLSAGAGAVSFRLLLTQKNNPMP